MSHKLISLARETMLIRPEVRWYGNFLTRICFVAEPIDTIGVRIMKTGIAECVVNPVFLDGIAKLPNSLEIMIAIIIHEINHLVLLHPYRVYGKLHTAYNHAADAIINGAIDNPRIPGLPKSFPCIIDGEIVGDFEPTFFPIESGLPPSATTEEIYKYYIKNGINGSLIDDHAVWKTSTASAELAFDNIKELVKSTTNAVPGSIPNHLTEQIKTLMRTPVHWRQLHNSILDRALGNRKRTMRRRSRRWDKFGIPGIIRRTRPKLTICLDTSKSIDHKTLDKYFGYIDQIAIQFEVKLVQFDAVIQSVKPYRCGDWNRILVRGRGGTKFSSLFEGLVNDHLFSPLTIIITDGVSDYPEKPSFNILWILSSNLTPPYGAVVKIT